MSTRQGTRDMVLVGALLLGLLADQLEHVREQGHPGVNVFLWAMAATLVLWWLSRGRETPVSGETRLLVGGALLLTGFLALRDSEVLTFFSFLSAVILLGFAAGRGALAWARRAYIADIAAAAIRVGVLILLGPLGWSLGAARNLPDVGSAEGRRWPHYARMVARGVVMGLPPLLLLTALLASADPVFDGILRAAFLDRIEPTLEHLLFVGLIAWFTSGYLRAFLVGDEALMERVRLPRPTLAPSEVAVALSLLDLLFLAFLVVQVRYLFGGAELIEVTEGLSYADYARRGFFELVVTTVLVVPILLVAEWAAAEDDERGRRAFRATSTLLVLLLMGVLGSAAYRMHLYQEAYGLTEQRMYGSVFMLWLTGVLAWLALTVLRGQRKGFAPMAIAGGIACLAVLHLLNPHALIARMNLDRAAAGEQYDIEYLETLSADAVPTLIDRLEVLPLEETCSVTAILKERWSGERIGGWRSWNFADARARKAVAELQEPMGCAQILPPPTEEAPAAESSSEGSPTEVAPANENPAPPTVNR